MARWSTKAAISVKHVKIEEKLLWRAYRRSPMLFQMVPAVTLTTSSSPRLAFTTPNQNTTSRMAKVTVFKFSVHIHTVDQNKSASKQLGKSMHRHSQGVSKTFRALIYKARHVVIFVIAQLSCSY